MELVRPYSLSECEIEVVQPTKVKAFSNKDIDNDGQKYINFIHKPNTEVDYLQKSKLAQSDEFLKGNDEDYLVIDFLEDDGIDSGSVADGESYVDINLKSSKQMVIYLARKPRLLIRCHSRTVNLVSVLTRRSSGRYLVFPKPIYRLTISKTEFWYYNHCHTIYLHPVRKNTKKRPMHYTEKVEFQDESVYPANANKTNDLSGYQLTFLKESNQEISKLTLSSDFALSCEEKATKLDEISKDIDISGPNEDPAPLKRSYSIEFLNEDKSKSPFSADDVSSRIEQGEGHDICLDSDYESETSFDSSRNGQSTDGKPDLRRSYSIEFLSEKEEEQQPLSAEMVSYQINEGKGKLIYSDVERMAEHSQSVQSSTTIDEPGELKRSFSIEFIDEKEKQKSNFSYETISSKIEKGQVRLIYSDGDVDPVPNKKRMKKSPSKKLKTLDVSMNVDDDEQIPLSNEKRAYSIEFLHEIDDQIVPSFPTAADQVSETESAVEDQILVSEVFTDEQEPEFEVSEEHDSLGLQPRIVDIDIDQNANDDPLLEKKAYNIKFLDEKPDLSLVLEGNQTSTPVKKSSPLNSPRKSPLQTISINLEFEKRNRAIADENELFINDADDYLVYEGSKTHEEKNKSYGGHQEWSALKLKTINIDMETHHKRRRSSLLTDRNFHLEFQTEKERRMSLMKARKERPASDSTSPLRTISVETDSEEVVIENESEPTPKLLKKKWYSVEMLSEIDGDKSVFAEEIDDGECRWTLDV